MRPREEIRHGRGEVLEGLLLRDHRAHPQPRGFRTCSRKGTVR
ncbi:hypothetical protein H4W34_004326 [Actinomadura algeriensis]|uniref:Uncharacterized protein n=1 Tax=Actinomadura algeriensis TaxID=1679523 RepID=A0ABR9JVI9_9ACTN|nr:hypothetical protein [Actinomadura algeriensis]